MRRKPGQLLPLERAICREAHDLGDEFHGYQMAKRLQEVADARLLTAYGTLYRALSRLEGMGLLKSRWEDPRIPARENRPGRRLYSLTALGEAIAGDNTITVRPASRKRLRRKWASA
jgi:DNA-binding PadR family transcriptional regulator